MRSQEHHEYSYNDLHRWSHRLFEKLGWMVLAYRDDKDHKVYSYLRDMEELRKVVEARVVGCLQPDEREELLDMYKNLHTLESAATELFAGVITKKVPHV